MSGISKSRPYRPEAARITDPARRAGLLNQAPLVPENGQTLVADDLLGGGFRDQGAFDFQLEALLEERGSVDPHPSRSGVPQKAAAQEAQSVSTDPIGFGFCRSRAG